MLRLLGGIERPMLHRLVVERGGMESHDEAMHEIAQIRTRTREEIGGDGQRSQVCRGVRKRDRAGHIVSERGRDSRSGRWERADRGWYSRKSWLELDSLALVARPFLF